MVGIGILVAVPPVRPAGRMQIRRVAVDQFRTPEREAGQERVRTAMHQFHRVLAPEPVKCALIAVNPDAAHRRGLAGHQRTATEMGFDIQIVRRLQPQQRLTQPGRGLGSEVPHRWYPSTTMTTFIVRSR